MDFDKIYFDMDGVLVDFDWGVENLCRIKPEVQGHASKGYDEHLFSVMATVPHFYAQLPPMEETVSIVKELYEKYGDRVEILTGIPRPERNIKDAKEDKIEWIRKHVSADITINAVLRAEKKDFCKDRRSVLVDDFEKNIKEWRNLGGTGILFTTAEELRKDIFG